MGIYKYMKTKTYDKNGETNLLKKVFEDKTLRFTSPLSFNDPFELNPYIKNLINEEKHIVVDAVSAHINSIGKAHEFYKKIRTDLLEHTGMLCLSGKQDNLLMWAHYADEHRGIVLEFDKSHPFLLNPILKENTDLLFALEKVKYNKNRPHIDSDAYLEKEKQIFLIKSKDWEYEDEYRMMLLLDELDNSSNKYNIEFPSEMIKSIYIGCQAEKETIKYIHSLKQQVQWKHLKVFKMKIDTIDYKLIPREIR